MKRTYSKAIKKKLRQLAGAAYQRDLDSELDKLKERFDDWQAGEIDCFELSDRIHTFHDGASRDLWKFYTGADPDLIVAHAVINKIISREEAGEDVLDQIRPLLEYYEQRKQADLQENDTLNNDP